MLSSYVEPLHRKEAWMRNVINLQLTLKSCLQEKGPLAFRCGIIYIRFILLLIHVETINNRFIRSMICLGQKFCFKKHIVNIWHYNIIDNFSMYDNMKPFSTISKCAASCLCEHVKFIVFLLWDCKRINSHQHVTNFDNKIPRTSSVNFQDIECEKRGTELNFKKLRGNKE